MKNEQTGVRMALGGPGGRNSFWMIALFLGLFALGANPVWAVTFTVNSAIDAVDANPGDGFCASAAGQCTLRAAVMEINATVPSGAIHTINLPSGSYILTLANADPAGEDGAATGDLDITTADEVVLTGAGASTTVIQGNVLDPLPANPDRVFHILGGNLVAIAGVTIRDGYVIGVSAYGGGVLVDVGTLDLDNCVLINNYAALDGGGVYYKTTPPPLGNRLAQGPIFWSNVTLDTNVADGNGGALYNDNFIEIQRSLFQHNQASTGGALYTSANGTTWVSISTFFDNSSDNFSATNQGGGAIYNEGALTLETSALHQNFAVFNGGAIYNNNAPGLDLVIRNVTISTNTAQNSGGGIFSASATGVVSLTNATVAFNDASTSGAGIAGPASITLKNTIVGNNSLGITANDCSNALTSQDGNIQSTASCGFALANDITGDPLLQPLGNNGGPTMTHALQPGSPALSAAVFDAAITIDQRLLPRGNPYDIGAFECCFTWLPAVFKQ